MVIQEIRVVDAKQVLVLGSVSLNYGVRLPSICRNMTPFFLEQRPDTHTYSETGILVDKLTLIHQYLLLAGRRHTLTPTSGLFAG